MAVISPLYALVNRVGQLALQEGSNPSRKAHFELLRMIDELRLAVETPTETVLRLVYQISRFINPRKPKIVNLTRCRVTASTKRCPPDYYRPQHLSSPDRKAI